MEAATAAEVTVAVAPLSSPVVVNDDTAADLSFTVATPTAGTYDVQWWVEDDLGVDQPPAGSFADVVFAADITQQFDVDLTGLTVGDWFVRVGLTGTTDTGTSDKAAGSFSVGGVAQHVVVTKASGTFYPVKDGYLDGAVVKTTANFTFSEMVVRNAGNQIIAHPYSLEWRGNNLHGDLAPEGVYTLELVAHKGSDYESHYDAGTVMLSHKRLVTKTFRKVVTPAGSLVGKPYVGRCSTLKRPSDRGWAGSFGLYTATKCKGTFKTTVIGTDHAMRMPRAIRYKRLRISTYGGAARSQPGSYLFFDQFSTARTWGKDDTRLGYGLAWHAGPVKAASEYVFDDRWIYWGVYTYLGARYDLKTFKVVLTYQVLG
jgi:hypothetical protein